MAPAEKKAATLAKHLTYFTAIENMRKGNRFYVIL